MTVYAHELPGCQREAASLFPERSGGRVMSRSADLRTSQEVEASLPLKLSAVTRTRGSSGRNKLGRSAKPWRPRVTWSAWVDGQLVSLDGYVLLAALNSGGITRLRLLFLHDDGLIGPVWGRKYSEGLLRGGVIVVLDAPRPPPRRQNSYFRQMKPTV